MYNGVMGTLKVPICDDSAAVREHLVTMAPGLPATAVVGQARDGPECLDTIRQTRCDVVILDGYCVKGRKKRTIAQGTVGKTSKGRPMAKGVCPECSATVIRFLSDKESKE